VPVSIDPVKILAVVVDRGGTGLIYWGSGFIPRAWDFLGLKNLLNKLGLSQAQAWALLHK
jgi:hypothetical protein